MFISALKIIVEFFKNLLFKKSTKPVRAVEFSNIEFVEQDGTVSKGAVGAGDLLVSDFDNTIIMNRDFILNVSPTFLDEDGKETKVFESKITWSINAVIPSTVTPNPFVGDIKTEETIVPDTGEFKKNFLFSDTGDIWCSFAPKQVGTYQIAILLDADVSEKEEAVLGYFTVSVR